MALTKQPVAIYFRQSKPLFWSSENGKVMLRSSRRFFLLGAGSTLSLPFFYTVGFTAEVDVVIIGAGAAGLGVARTLLDKGINVKVLEANNRIGGRAYTEKKTFGVPFDHGCTIQHIAHRNPFVGYARKNGFKIGKLPSYDLSKVFIGHREATAREYKRMASREKAIRNAFAAAGRSGKDISLKQALAKVRSNKWSPIAEYWNRDSTGQELEDVSVKDWWAGAEGDNYYCRAGYGTLVAHYGRNVPVELNTVVTQIDWSGQGAKITTNKGVINARYCIITVSIGVLAANQVRFLPELPNWKREAIDGFGMGNFLNIGLKFNKKRIIPVRDTAYFWVNGSHDQLLAFISNLGGWGVSRATASGDLAKELEDAGEKDAIDFALKRLKSALGSHVMKSFRKGVASTWINDPLTRGTWALAKPGKARLRADLRRQIGKQIFFAGEACHTDMFATCHGALMSGQSTARIVASKFN